MRRGEIWWADLPDPVGSEPGFRRPVLMVQEDSFNRSRIATVVVGAIASNVFLASAPGNVRLPKNSTGLKKESLVNVSQVATLIAFCLRDVRSLTISGGGGTSVHP